MNGMRRVLCSLALALTLSFVAWAQAVRRPTTVDGLRQFPGFYHLQAVLVHGDLVVAGARTMLRTEDHEIRLVLGANVHATPGPVEVRGMLLDVGRLEPGDVRLGLYPRPNDNAWPKPGEELVINASSVSMLPPSAPPLTMRSLALEPWRFEGQAVTLSGQFRGRNLFGDLGGAPRKSSFDFVVKNGDSAVWVVGMRPRGKGFDLDIDARHDTARWLEVAGIARRVSGLVTIEASRLALTTETQTTEREEPAPPPPPSPPIEVVFSAPSEGETDVRPEARVRIQFSRNIKPETLKEHLKATYIGPPSAAELQIEPKTAYDAATRGLVLTFAKPLERTRTVKIELTSGILGFDGVPLAPWTLTFTVGG
jgi:hypothetical protein